MFRLPPAVFANLSISYHIWTIRLRLFFRKSRPKCRRLRGRPCPVARVSCNARTVDYGSQCTVGNLVFTEILQKTCVNFKKCAKNMDSTISRTRFFNGRAAYSAGGIDFFRRCTYNRAIFFRRFQHGYLSYYDGLLLRSAAGAGRRLWSGGAAADRHGRGQNVSQLAGRP